MGVGAGSFDPATHIISIQEIIVLSIGKFLPPPERDRIRPPTTRKSSNDGICRLRLLTSGTDPALVGLGVDLNASESGVAEEVVMLVRAEKGNGTAIGVFFGELGGHGVGAFIDLGDEDKRASRLDDAEDFAHVAGQVRPPEVGLDGGD